MSTSPGAESKTAQYRQYGLAALLAVMAIYFGGEWLWENAIDGPIREAERTGAKLTKGLEQRKTTLARARAAADVLENWKAQSLPADLEVARSLYQTWLVELVGDVEFSSPSVSSSEGAGLKGVYNALAFSLRARGTLDQLRRFLFGFYQTDLLHQIRSLNITPISNSELLDLSITIEALSLVSKGAGDAAASPETIFEQFRQCTLRVSDRLASDRLEAYDPIVRRNLFGAGHGEADPTDHTYLTSITITDGEPEVWFTLRTTDEVVKLREGDSMQVGALLVTVAQARGTDVIIETDDERWLLTLGDKLTDAFALPPEF
jgi:hypothetical protein